MNRFILLTYFLFLSVNLFSQSATKKTIYNTYDNIVGIENTGIFNGKEFKDPFLNTDGTYRYFNGFKFTNGTVIYDDQFYADIPLKYDVYQDNLITRSNDNFKIFNIKLIPNKISSFSIYNRNFINLKNLNFDFEGNHFFEIAYNGALIKFYIKHIKKKREKAVEGLLEHRFFNDNYYVVLYKGNYHRIKTIGDLKNIFSEEKDKVKEYYKSHKKTYRSDRDDFMQEVIEQIDKNISVKK